MSDSECATIDEEDFDCWDNEQYYARIFYFGSKTLKGIEFYPQCCSKNQSNAKLIAQNIKDKFNCHIRVMFRSHTFFVYADKGRDDIPQIEVAKIIDEKGLTSYLRENFLENAGRWSSEYLKEFPDKFPGIKSKPKEDKINKEKTNSTNR